MTWEGNRREEIEAFEKFAEIAKAYIYSWGTPHSTIIVTQAAIEISDGRMAIDYLLKENHA